MPIDIRNNYNIAHLTWMKVGGCAQQFYRPSSSAELAGVLQQNYGKMPVHIIGNGSNILPRDGLIAGMVIKLSRGFTGIEIKDNQLEVGAGCLNQNLAKFCAENAITGFEFLIGIPGSIGGGVFMNAGAYGSEFKDIVIAAEVISPSGQISMIDAKDLGFSYRSSSTLPGSIITKVLFRMQSGDKAQIKQKMHEIKTQRATTQPITEKTSGSTFKNPPGHKAWQLIDDARLRGAGIGGAKFSEMHCNFIINTGSATAADIENLCDLAIKKVEQKSGVKLELEIKKI